MLVQAGCTSNKATDTPSSTKAPVRMISTEMALADFDRVWELVRDTHFDTTYNGVDWEAVRVEFRPKAEAALTRNELRGVIGEALGRLNQSHFGIIPDETEESDHAVKSTHEQIDKTDETKRASRDESASDSEKVAAVDGVGDADTGIDLRIIEGQAVVSSIREESPAAQAGVKTGWVLSKIRSSNITDRLESMSESLTQEEVEIHAVAMLTNRLQGMDGSTIDLTFLDGNDEQQELTLTRSPMPGEIIKFGGLPPISTHLEWSQISTQDASGVNHEIGVIKFNIWLVPIAPRFERAMYELQDTDGIIIDLRGNPGGIGALSSSIGRFIVSEKASLGTMIMRGAELQFNIEPVIVTTWGEPIDPFDGPIAILTDSGTASTSEVFAGGLQSLGRVKVFGTRSAGMALPASMDKLPSGDTFLHAIANFVTSTGQQLEHGGVVPDQEVRLTRADLLKGVDSPMKEAQAWISQEARNN